MVHMFRKHALLENTKGADKPIDVYSIGGATHCDTSGTINNIGDVYLNENGLANILYYAKVKDRHNIAYNDVNKIFTVHTPYKYIHF